MSAPEWHPPERRALARLAAEFARREILPGQDEWEATGEIPRELHRRTAEVGLLGVGYPEEVGGAGGGLVDGLVVAEAMITAGAATGVLASLMSHSIALPALIRFGTPDQVERFVRPALAGEVVCSLAVTEPDTGSDVARLRTRAVRSADGYLVTGAKTYITSGVRADFVTTAVRTGGPGHGGISLLVIERGTPGFTVTRKLDKMGWRSSDTAELSFTDVPVPAANLVGAEGAGFRQIVTQFQPERLQLAVQAYALAQRCLDLTVAWVRARETFGRPLASRQVIRHRVAEMARQVDVARSYVRAVAGRLAAGEDVVREVSMAKNTAVFACSHVVDEAVQLHGGLGYMRGSEVERHYRDARILGIGGGTTEIMNEIIADRLLGG
jgi:acyl-CoA dehydrogenase